MRSLRAWLSSAACMVCSALLLSGCSTSAEDEAKINSVITALPTEVVGCTFLGEVDSGSHTFTLQSARNYMRLAAAELGANTVVETHVIVTPDLPMYLWPDPIFGRPYYSPYMDSETFYVTGRAYHCALGQGVKVPTITDTTVQPTHDPLHPQHSQTLDPAVDADSPAQPAPAPAPAPAPQPADSTPATVEPAIGIGVGFDFDL